VDRRETSQLASMGHGDKYISDEGTSIWDLGLVDTSGVDVGSPGWHGIQVRHSIMYRR